MKVCIYPDGEQYEEPPHWKSDDYEVREVEVCITCEEPIEMEYQTPTPTCKCTEGKVK